MGQQEAKPGRHVTVLVAFFGVLAVLALIGFIYPWRLEVAAEEGAGIDATITYLLIVTGLIMLAGHGVLCWFLWRSANGPAQVYKRPSRRAEWKWAIIPVVLMIALSEGGVLLVSGPVWDSLYVEQPKDPWVAQIMAKQFEWWIHYPGKNGKFGEYKLKEMESENPLGLDPDEEVGGDDVWKRGLLTVPVNRPVVLFMETRDVIHSFFVPHFRVKQDIIPGFKTRLKFTPTRTGVFELVCTELCGLGHYKMRGEVHVLSPEDFAAWQAKQKPTFGD